MKTPQLARVLALALCGSALLAGCGRFDKESAALQIRGQFCEDWPFGCTDSTEVRVEKVNETRHGRQVLFKVVDREDETPVLTAAYFERQDKEWRFLFFEPPFSERFDEEKGQVATVSRRFSEELTEVKRAQNWFLTIYGRYARSLAELDSVSYKPPPTPIIMEVTPDRKSWRAEISSRHARCVLDVATEPLPVCQGLPAANAGSRSGPLSTAFGEQR
jgi:hypothetical protein